RQEMSNAGASELLLPALQPLELWIKSGRDKDIGEVMIRFTDRRGRHICLGPTHEEVITDLVRAYLSSYKQLPLVLYQIQTKFRDEIRPRFGVVRACEFIMKDAYSFDQDEEGLDKSYQAVYDAYHRIFLRCGLEILTQEADSGLMGGKVSHEFMVQAASGEDAVLLCANCKCIRPFNDTAKDICPKCNVKLEKINAIEIGHVFKLGTKYSAALGANFVDNQGALKPVIMGCYGIGVSRLMAAIVEQNNDAEGIIWPVQISPYKVIILPLDVTDSEIMRYALAIYKELEENDIEPLLDDRDERAGVKFKDADLLGLPVIITVGKKTLKEQKIEIKTRKDKKIILVDKNEAINRIRGILTELTVIR
ncbi:MAG: aminoacyl--tRNA ligase-related protein, partial [Candidatus Omnitrophota bacterium]